VTGGAWNARPNAARITASAERTTSTAETVSPDAEAVTFGVDEAKYGQIVEAAVVLHGEATPDELRRHARESLAAFKVPERIHILDEIPKTATGKVQRSRLSAQLSGGGL